MPKSLIMQSPNTTCISNAILSR